MKRKKKYKKRVEKETENERETRGNGALEQRERERERERERRERGVVEITICRRFLNFFFFFSNLISSFRLGGEERREGDRDTNEERRLKLE